MFDVSWHLLNSLTNKVGMGATIGPINILEPFLFGFDPWQTHSHYRGNWERLFTDIKKKHAPPGPCSFTTIPNALRPRQGGTRYW
jgi:hypothetical protein